MDRSSRNREIAVLVFACVLPTLVTLVYFVWAAGSASSVQQTIYSVAKLVQFALPAVWVWLVCREKIAWPQWRREGIGVGIAFGIAVALALAALYMVVSDWPQLAGPLDAMREKIAAMGLNQPIKFALVGVFYALVHSLLEEYYWRWFVLGRMKNIIPVAWAVVISSVMFAAHHLVVLWSYFSENVWLAVLFTAFVAVGGVAWALIYHRWKSILAVWVSHLIVDAAIFAVGYAIARPVF